MHSDSSFNIYKVIVTAVFVSVSIVICLVPAYPSDEPIKINLISAQQLSDLRIRGLGEKTAEKIIDYRNNNGYFKSYSDLDGAPRVG